MMNRTILNAALAAMLFSPNLWEKPVFAQETATVVNVGTASEPAEKREFQADVLRFIGDGDGRQFIYATPSHKMEKGTFFGVTTSNVPAAMREQMSLPRGFGLVVETVEKDSPAEKAGIQKYDILQKLNDQLLVNQPQLQVLVRSMKPGDSVSITLLRKGQPVTVNATLIEKDVPEFSDATFDVFTPGASPRIMQWQGVGAPAAIVNKLLVENDRNVNIVADDGEQTLELTRKDGVESLVVKDKTGKVIFDGPVGTPEQRASLPEGVAEKLQKMDAKLKKITVRVHAGEGDPKEPAEEK